MSRPTVFVPSAEGNPCPCTAGAAQHTTPTMIIFGQPTRQPTACLSRAMAQRLYWSNLTHIYKYLTLDHHRPQLDVPCVHVETVQDQTSEGPSHSQPGPAEMNRSSTSKQSSEQPAGQPVAQPSPHPALTTSRASLLTSEMCFEPNSVPQTNPAYPSPCSNPISLEKARVPTRAA